MRGDRVASVPGGRVVSMPGQGGGSLVGQDAGAMADRNAGRGQQGLDKPVVLRMESLRNWPAIDTMKLRAAVGGAFGEGGAPLTGTRAVVVVWRGQLVLERYAPGFNRTTRLAGWSMAKGITNALTGILVRQGKLNTGSPAPVAGWSGDDRRLITIADLLHMNSGLRWWEFYGGPSDATDMLFKENNMGEYAAQSGLKHPPDWCSTIPAARPTSLVTLFAGRWVTNTIPLSCEQLFDKTGMYSAVLEPDASGTYVGSSYCYATARDWARFGLLYLHDGVLGRAADTAGGLGAMDDDGSFLWCALVVE